MLVRARLRHLPCSLLSSAEPSFSRTSASSFVRGSPDALFTRTGASSSAAVTPTMMASPRSPRSRSLSLSLSLASRSPRAALARSTACTASLRPPVELPRKKNRCGNVAPKKGFLLQKCFPCCDREPPRSIRSPRSIDGGKAGKQTKKKRGRGRVSRAANRSDRS